MNKRFMFVVGVMLTILGIAVSLYIMKEGSRIVAPEYTTEINRHLLSLRQDWNEVVTNDSKRIASDQKYDYAILDMDGRLLVYTKDDIAKSLTAATTDYDIIRDIEVDGNIVGRLIVDNKMLEKLNSQNIRLVIAIAITIIVLLIILTAYFFYIYRNVEKAKEKEQTED